MQSFPEPKKGKNKKEKKLREGRPGDKCKNWLLTYPHCDLPNEFIMEKIREIEQQKFIPIDTHFIYVVVGKEFHEDGEEHHHVSIITDRPIRLKKSDMNIFDLPNLHPPENVTDVTLNNNRNSFHPNIEHAASPKFICSYTKKDGNFITSGTCPFLECLSKKEKNELILSKSLSQLVKEGVISISHVQSYKRGLDILRLEEASGKKTEKPYVHWYYGKTGTGKTRSAFEEASKKYGESIWWSSTNDSWFDGYIGQEAVIIDDLRARTWNFSFLLRLLDRYPITVPIKGGFSSWRPKEIWITAPECPERIYRNYQTNEPYDGIEQLQRRIDDLKEFEAESPN